MVWIICWNICAQSAAPNCCVEGFKDNGLSYRGTRPMDWKTHPSIHPSIHPFFTHSPFPSSLFFAQDLIRLTLWKLRRHSPVQCDYGFHVYYRADLIMSSPISIICLLLVYDCWQLLVEILSIDTIRFVTCWMLIQDDFCLNENQGPFNTFHIHLHTTSQIVKLHLSFPSSDANPTFHHNFNSNQYSSGELIGL